MLAGNQSMQSVQNMFLFTIWCVLVQTMVRFSPNYGTTLHFGPNIIRSTFRSIEPMCGTFCRHVLSCIIVVLVVVEPGDGSQNLQ